MKRILSLVLILILSIGMLCACQIGGDNTTTVPSTTEPTPTEPTHVCKYDVNKAKNYLNSLYIDWLDNNATSVDYTVATLVPVGSDRYTVEWTVDNDAITITPDDSGIEATVSVPSMGAEDVTYTLTGVVSAPDGCTAEISFELKVPALDLNTHEEYMAAEEGDVLQISGIVVAINAKSLGNKYNHVFLADASGKGGYYCYSVTADPAEMGVKVGMTVMVTGPMTPYSGMQEIKGGEVIILDETIKEVAPLDITELFAAGADLGAYVGMPVVVKGVEIGSQDMSKDTSQYLYFSIGEKQGYLRTYVTDFAVGNTADEMASIKATIDADHLAHFGYKADVTGILVLYNGAPYLIPMSAAPFTNYVEVEKTPAEKVASEKENLKIETSFAADAVVTLPLVGTNYEDVAMSWVSSDTTAISIAEDGTATVTVPDTKTVVTLTVTFTCGEATDTQTVEVTLNKVPLTAGEAIEIGAAKEHNTYTEGKYLIAGVVTEVYNETYGNMKITDEFGNVLTVYGSYSADGSTRYDSMESKPVVGDYVVLLGVLGQYNGAAQTKNAWIISWTSPTSVSDANTIGTNNPSYTTDKYLVTGTVTEVANTKYGNLYIEDAEGNKLYLYGLYDQLGNRYDAMTNAPAVGDTITVLTVLGAYNNSPQGKNATLVAHTVATTEEEGEEPVDGVYTIPQVLAAAEGTSVIVKGTVESFYYDWSDTYGNCSVYIIDDDGNKLLCFRLATKVAVGDQITVTGSVTAYNGVNQIAAGCTAVIDTPAS